MIKYKSKYTEEMLPVMCKAFFGARLKGNSVKESAAKAKKKLEQKFKGVDVCVTGISAKCYDLRRKGYQWDTKKSKKSEQVKTIGIPDSGRPEQMTFKLPNLGMEITVLFTDK
jgi:hypothetical protein